MLSASSGYKLLASPGHGISLVNDFIDLRTNNALYSRSKLEELLLQPTTASSLSVLSSASVLSDGGITLSRAISELSKNCDSLVHVVYEIS